jgi:hypothetical protein
MLIKLLFLLFCFQRSDEFIYDFSAITYPLSCVFEIAQEFCAPRALLPGLHQFGGFDILRNATGMQAIALKEAKQAGGAFFRDCMQP